MTFVLSISLRKGGIFSYADFFFGVFSFIAVLGMILHVHSSLWKLQEVLANITKNSFWITIILLNSTNYLISEMGIHLDVMACLLLITRNPNWKSDSNSSSSTIALFMMPKFRVGVTLISGFQQLHSIFHTIITSTLL